MTITTTNPATGEHLADYEELTDGELGARLQKAHDAYYRWRRSGYDERTELLAAIADQFLADKQRIARQMTLEMGKTYSSAIAEAEKCASAFRYYAENGPDLLAETRIELAGGGSAIARYIPQGPVLAVMPWNFPFWQAVRFLAPTIMAGNTGLLKHASSVMGCAEMLETTCARAGAPDGLFQNLIVKADKVAGIIADDRIVAATLTGSEGAGSAIGAAAGAALKKVVLELGGSDPFIVMPSADLEKAARDAVRARTMNTGQSCICGKRMIVHADIFDEFMRRFGAGMEAVVTGDPFAAETDMGPLSSMEQRDTVLDQVTRARQGGASLELGGEALGDKGAYMSAGILTGFSDGSAMLREEIFGPVAIVQKAEDRDHAIRLANNQPYGLGSAVYTNDEEDRYRFAYDIEAGMTAFNQILSSTPEAPFGGIKRSGHGRELGPWGLHEFMNLKTVFLPD